MPTTVLTAAEHCSTCSPPQQLQKLQPNYLPTLSSTAAHTAVSHCSNRSNAGKDIAASAPALQPTTAATAGQLQHCNDCSRRCSQTLQQLQSTCSQTLQQLPPTLRFTLQQLQSTLWQTPQQLQPTLQPVQNITLQPSLPSCCSNCSNHCSPSRSQYRGEPQGFRNTIHIPA